MKIIDAHQHAGVVDSSHDSAWRANDIKSRRQYLERHGMSGCVLLPTPKVSTGAPNDVHAAVNSMLADYVKESGETVLGACATVNPRYPKEAAAEADRALSSGLTALAFHHRYLGLVINDGGMGPVLEVAEKRDATVFIHIISDSTFEGAWRLFALARRHPKVRFLALDGFSSAMQASMIREVAPDHPNVWFDTGAMTSVAHGLEEFIEHCGAERLIFGTDFYTGVTHFRIPYPLVELKAMGLDDAALTKICHDNIAELMRPRR